MIPDTLHRRRFLQSTATAFAALAASGCVARNIATPGVAPALPYGPLKADPAGMLDLPEGFSIAAPLFSTLNYAAEIG